MPSFTKKDKVSLFPEAGLGYLVGPILALLSNGVVNNWLIQYWDKVLQLCDWAPLFETLLPILSSIVIIVGNLIVGKLMERKPKMAGKARPLILLAMPFVTVALLALFLMPLPEGAGGNTSNILASIVIALAYNLYYAFAWPIYYTSHSALVNLSTRDEKGRGLLSTCIMAAQLGAAGVAGMAGGFLVDIMGLLPKYTYLDDAGVEKVADAVKNIPDLVVAGVHAPRPYTTVVSPADANSKWVVLMIIMAVALVIGCLLEYFFTRERITEELVEQEAAKAARGEVDAAKGNKVAIADQIKVCVKDKYWWLIIIFFFLYQFGGQMKNIDMTFYSAAFTGEYSLSGMINTVGAVPTALGMVIVWPLANKFNKAKTIVMGCALALVGGAISFLCLVPALSSGGALWGISIASFCVKALGTAPAMYISLALMANVLDHQEARSGIRTDGFTMAVYGSIMIAMSGICNGVIVGINNALGSSPLLHTFLGFGVESICYAIMGVMFIFMNVENYIDEDKKILAAKNVAAEEPAEEPAPVPAE